MQTRESIPVSTRITAAMQKAMDNSLETNGHLNVADYMRDLLRKDLESRGLLKSAGSSAIEKKHFSRTHRPLSHTSAELPDSVSNT
jgi:Arc/MetJ-type ribon-helix-helix transcriptional regulator